MENQSLVLRDKIKNELLQIKTVEEGVTHLNRLNTIEVWVKSEKKDAELQNIIAEQKLRTQRILGNLLKETELDKGGRPITGNLQEPVNPTLSKIGINKKQSSTFQQIASIPEDDFEEFIAEKKEAVNNAVAELTTTGAVRLAKSIKQQREDLHVVTGINERLSIEKELKELANSINLKYTKDQRILFVRFIKI